MLRGALSQQGVQAGARGDLGQRENTDPPARFHEGGYGVQHSPHVYVIFWGSAWNESTGAVLRAQLLKMYGGLSGSSYQGILTQYFDSSGRVSSTVPVASYTDEGVTAPTSVNDKKIREEAAKAIAAKGWPRELDSQFVVIPAPGSSYEVGFGTGFCGYHELVEEHELDREYPYTFVPYVGEEPFRSGCIEYDEHQHADSVTSMIASHEYAESATDPGIDTWFTEEGFEIADICASKDNEVQEGSLKGSWVQGLWDEHESACSLSDAQPPYVNAITEPGASPQPHEVKLAGIVDPEGLETHYHFEYGATTSYGTSVPAPDASTGSSAANVSVSETVSGLPEGIYHYRLVASNGTGTTYGEDRLAISRVFNVQALPEPPGSTEEHEAYGVSCVAQICTAVGAYWNITAHVLDTMAETFNGGEWSAQPTPNPSGATESSLQGVSCLSASECTAVGRYKNATGAELALAERWNGMAWSIQPTPSPPGATESSLQGVSCLSASECTAVGRYKNATGAELALAERWNGMAWSIQPTPSPPGATESSLQGVSCASTECTAVGASWDSSGSHMMLAERWNGVAWLIQSTPNLSGATESSQLRGVSCSSPDACTAVGSQERGGNVWALAERWNGSEWSLQSTYEELNGGIALSGVSCASSTECTAVGSYHPRASPRHATEVLAERWNGATMTVLAMPGLPKASGMWRENWLEGVSCTERTVCIAVGDTLTAPFGSGARQVGIAEREFAAPVVTTEPASGVVSGEATLNGMVNPQALETRYHFEYGTTLSYGSSVPVAGASAGSAVGHPKVTELITGLQANTTYHYRLLATNADGSSYGEDVTFTTPAAPAPSNISPPSISGSTVQGQTLTETHGAWSNDPTSYAYQWEDCDSSGANCWAITGATDQTYTLTAADVGRTIRVQETASNASGTGGAMSSAATALVQGTGSGSGSGGSGGSLGSGGGSGGETAHLASVSAAIVHGNVVLVPLSCRGSAGSSCAVTLTLTVLERLRRGRLVAVSAAAGTRHKVNGTTLIQRTVIVGRGTVMLMAGESEVVRVALNATGKWLLEARHVLAVKLAVSENGVRLSRQIVRFKAPAREARRRR